MSSWNTEANLGTKHCTYIDSVNQNTIKNTFWAPFSSLPPKQSITSKILEIEKRSIKSFVIFSEQTIGEVFIARLLKNKKSVSATFLLNSQEYARIVLFAAILKSFENVEEISRILRSSEEV